MSNLLCLTAKAWVGGLNGTETGFSCRLRFSAVDISPYPLSLTLLLSEAQAIDRDNLQIKQNSFEYWGAWDRNILSYW